MEKNSGSGNSHNIKVSGGVSNNRRGAGGNARDQKSRKNENREEVNQTPYQNRTKIER